MLPFQAPSRRFLREFGPSVDAAVRRHGVEGSARILAKKLASPGAKAPPHVARLLGNLASIYSTTELEKGYADLLRSCASSRMAAKE